eukprot:scaffold287584_cov30-Tisochrysis_lutea.AAC.1
MEGRSDVSAEGLLEAGGGGGRRELKRLRSNRVLLVVRSAAKLKAKAANGGGSKRAERRSFAAGSWLMLTKSPLYVLLLCVPPALIAPHVGMSDGAIFALSCCAILPLAGLLGDATEQVRRGAGGTSGRARGREARDFR